MYYQDFVKWSAHYMKQRDAGDDATDVESAEWNGAAEALMAYACHAWGIGLNAVSRDMQRAYDALDENC